MSSLNAINSAVINVGGTAGGLIADAGLVEKFNQRPQRVTFFAEGKGVILSCDATLSESHTFESSPTMFPVEDGSVISDHVVQNPVSFTFTGVVSDTPIFNKLAFLETEISAAVSGFIPPLGVTVAGGALALFNVLKNSPKKSQVAFDTLVALRNPDKTGQQPPIPFTLLTKYHRYQNMVITSLNFPVDASTDGQCVFTVTCSQIIIVKPLKVATQSLKNQATSAAVTKLGQQTGGNSAALDGVTKGYNDTGAVTDSPTKRLVGAIRSF